MDYRVAVDTPDKKMHATWFKPTGTGGIPTAYIIDQKGLVAWTGIGSPKVIERIVGEVLAGTFDSKKEIERQKQEDAEAKVRAEKNIAEAREKNKGQNNKFPGYQEAMDKGDRAAALEALNAAFKADASAETGGGYQWKYNLLMSTRKPEDVEAYARDLLARFPDKSDIHDYSCAVIAPMDEETPRFNAKLALELAERSATNAKPDSRWQQYAKWRLGWSYYHNDEKAKGIQSMEAALAGVRKLKDKFDFGDLADNCEEALKIMNAPAKP